MEDFKVRMLDEAQALWKKIMNLKDFIITNKAYKELSFKEKFAMVMQLFCMRSYYFWLVKRVHMCCTAEDITEYNNPTPVLLVDEPVEEVVVEKKPKVRRKAKKNTKHE